MVFGWLMLEKKRQEGRDGKGTNGDRKPRRQSFTEDLNAKKMRHRVFGPVVPAGHPKSHQPLVWDAWNQRRMQAEANGEPFTEPPPSARNGSSAS